MSDEPRVWIGCIQCYNEGRLVGRWQSASDASEATPEQIHRRPTHHEELWVMDHEGFHGLLDGECSPAEAQEIAEIIEGLPDYQPVEAFVAFVRNYGNPVTDDDALSNFEEAYCGEYDNEAEYAEQIAHDLGLVSLEASWPNGYIDWNRAARDLFMDGYWSAKSDSGIYVFRDL